MKINIDKDIKEKLTNIFSYYNKKFKLDIKLIFTNSANNCGYRHGTEIDIGINYLLITFKNRLWKKRFNYNNLIEYNIIVLLHELGHAIDFHCNHEKFMKNYQEVKEKYNKNEINEENYPKLPLEKEADKFANIEINKWR